MKHSVFVKFIAVSLCAAFLLGAVGSGVGALSLSEMGLYEQTVAELYEESRASLAEAFAGQIATGYASQTLGGCPEAMVDNYHIFNAGYYGYTLKDAEGNVLKELPLEYSSGGTNAYTFTVQQPYMKLLEIIPDSQRYEETAATMPPDSDDMYVIDNRPGDDVWVDEIYFYTYDGNDLRCVGENLGVLYHTTNGDVLFQSHDPYMDCPDSDSVFQASFFSDGRLIYQITSSDGVGEFAVDENGLLMVVLRNSDFARFTIPADPTEPNYIYNAIPHDGVEVQRFTFAYLGFDDEIEARSETYVGDGGVGNLFTKDDGAVIFIVSDPNAFPDDRGTVYFASFYGTDGELLYETYCPGGAGSVFNSEDSYTFHDRYVSFESWLEHEGIPNSATEPSPAIGVTEPLAENPTEAATQYSHKVLAWNLTNNIPAEGAYVHSVSFIDSNGPSSFSICSVTLDTRTGFLSYNADGAVIFSTTAPSPIRPDGDIFYYIAFYDADNQVIYEASNPDGVGSFYLDEENYLHFTSTMETAQPPTVTTAPMAEEPLPTKPGITDNIAKLGSKVSTILLLDGTGNTHAIDPGVPQGKAFAYLFRNEDGTVTCRSNDPMTLVAMPDTVLRVSFLDAEGNLLYAAQSGDGAGNFVFTGDTHMRFVTSVIPEAVTTDTEPYVEPSTVPDTTTATEEVQIPVDIPVETTIIAELTDPTEASEYASDEITGMLYYNHETGEHIHANYVYEDMPEAYTVELTLAPGAYEMDAVYDLLVWVWGYRNQLLYLLGASLLGFAITAVYLCCAAGRKKGREEVRAGGFNCLSLDVYLGAGGLAICALTVMGVEGGYYLLRYSPQILAPFAVIMSYTAALIIVGFCFACAAQFKTPGGYWWRNTLTVRCAKLAVQLLRRSGKLFCRFMGWLEAFLRKYFPKLGKAIVFCWNAFINLCIQLYRYTDKGLIRLGKGLGKVAQRTYAWLNAFLSLLPVTWQWLLIGLALLFILFLAILTRSEGWMVFGCLVGIALVVYGSHCFGLLLDSTKRMSKGDLETKVDDTLMVGCFKEFARDLNGLADVAVVAAQKQMQSDRMKTELITNVSHDIKTPLTSIINYVDLLQKPHTDEEQEAYLEVLSRQSLRMKKLLEDLIEMSKASTGNMTVHITDINAVEAVNQALGEFADKLDMARLMPMVQHPEQPVYMQADGRLVWRVLSNLLSNAVKYALPGTRVYIDIMEMDGKVLISLKNISREALNVSAEELMERFVRGDASRNTEGSGLGLNIAQSLMEIQKGKLQLTVDGDLFKVTLIFPGADA